MIHCRVCTQVAEHELSPTCSRCLYCGSDTATVYPDIAPVEWDDPFEYREPRENIWKHWGALGFLASNLQEQKETLVAAGALEQSPQWRLLLVEFVKGIKKNGFLHIETARPTVAAQPFAQVLSPMALQREFTPLGLAIINWHFSPTRQAYWLQKMDEVFKF